MVAAAFSALAILAGCVGMGTAGPSSTVRQIAAIGFTGTEDTDPSVQDQVSSTWTYWFVVAGEWRSLERDGVEPAGGVEGTALEHGREVRHLVKDPGPGMVMDPVGDVDGGRGKARRVGDIALVSASASATTLYLRVEIVGPAPETGRRVLGFSWDIDTTGDGFPEYSAVVSREEGDLWPAIGTDSSAARPIVSAAYDRSASAEVPLELIGDPTRIRVHATTLLSRDDEAEATDRAPDVEWIAVPMSGPPTLDGNPGALAGPAAAYIVAATVFDAAYTTLRDRPNAGDFALGPEDMPELVILLDDAMTGLGPGADLPGVAALIEELASVRRVAADMDADMAAFVYLVPYAIANQVGPLADAARARLGLPPRGEWDAI